MVEKKSLDKYKATFVKSVESSGRNAVLTMTVNEDLLSLLKKCSLITSSLIEFRAPYTHYIERVIPLGVTHEDSVDNNGDPIETDCESTEESFEEVREKLQRYKVKRVYYSTLGNSREYLFIKSFIDSGTIDLKVKDFNKLENLKSDLTNCIYTLIQNVLSNDVKTDVIYKIDVK